MPYSSSKVNLGRLSPVVSLAGPGLAGVEKGTATFSARRP
jgi:hypothetical protein